MIQSVKKYFELIVNHANYKEGDIVYVESEQRYRVLTGGIWKEINVQSDGFKLGLYELNQSIISQLKPLNEKELREAKELFNSFVKDTNNCFYMLYGKEISYFTLFGKTEHLINIELDKDINFGTAALDCLNYLGTIQSVHTSDDGAIECWVKTKEDLTTCLYFFPYDNGIIMIGE